MDQALSIRTDLFTIHNLERHISTNVFAAPDRPSEVWEHISESEERYRTLFDLAPVAVYSCDASGVIRDYDSRAAELSGRKP